MPEAVALVTGAGSGIGAATAVRLARDGARVAVNVLAAGEAAEVLSAVADAGGQAIEVVGDVSDVEDVARMVEETVGRLSGLTVAVNNAGLQEKVAFLDLDLATWRSMTSVDLDGAFLVSLAASRSRASRSANAPSATTSTSPSPSRVVLPDRPAAIASRRASSRYTSVREIDQQWATE